MGETYIEEAEPCIEVEEEATSISFQYQPEEKLVTEEKDDKSYSDKEELKVQQNTINIEASPQDISCADSVSQSYSHGRMDSKSFQTIENENKGLSTIELPMIDKEDVEDMNEGKDLPLHVKDETSADENESLAKEEDVTCEDESGIGTTEKDVKEEESGSETRETPEECKGNEKITLDKESSSTSPKNDGS